MNHKPDILCIGSVLWDIVGRSDHKMEYGNDRPGRIRRIPGGVALNIAMTLRSMGFAPALLSAVGQDDFGDDLMARLADMDLITDHIFRPADYPTDVYMAVEGPDGLVGAIADAHSLELCGDAILRSLHDGTLGSADAPYNGLIVIDGNLTADLLSDIAQHPLFAAAKLFVAPASPGKAERIAPFFSAPNATVYVNLEEACTLSGQVFANANGAAACLVDKGAQRVVVTNGGNQCADATQAGVVVSVPPACEIQRVTGAGDTFMAAHIAAERAGCSRQVALDTAAKTAADYVSGIDP